MVQLLYANTKNFSDNSFQRLIKLLPKDIQADIQRYHFMKDRKLKLMGRLLVQHYHASHQLPFNFLDICYNENGKPYLKSGPKFNISHSGTIVIVAFSNVEVGIDIEIARGVSVDDTHIFFHQEEIEWIKSSVVPDKAFLTLWTRKEAFLKATGTGIVNNLKEINGLTNLTFGGKNWYLHDFQFSDEYHVALCMPENNIEYEINEVNPESL